MNPKEALQGVQVVLVEPRSAGNIGAAARAMRNLGLARLTLVRPVDYRVPEGRRMAMGGLDLLERASEASTLVEAVSEAGLVIGTTRRLGKNRRPFLDVREAAGQAARAAASGNQVALVFGREDSGLTTTELGACHLLATIPTDPDCASLNLAQAVLLTAYEVRRALWGTGDAPAPPAPRATARETEAMYGEMASVLEEIGFLNPQNPEEILHAFRRLLGRAELEPREVRILRGVFRQVRWAARRGRDEPPR